jgi:hypothetical protein
MKNIIKNMAFGVLIASLSTTNIFSQSIKKKDFLYSNKFSLMAGLIQPIGLNGGNVELNYFTKRIALDFSHGFSLNPPVVGDFKTQGVELHLPYSTGFGVGYRFTQFLDVRFEPKLHSWEVYNKGEVQTEATKIKDFKTITMGIGIYYRYFPFKKSENTFLQGITTATSLRYWQNVGTTLSNDEFTYNNKLTGKKETLKAPNIGIANSPIIFNISVGYTFGGKN